MADIGIWRVTPQGPSRLVPGGPQVEKDLEDWIACDPEVLRGGLAIVGRQFPLDAGVLDLLALDPQGRWVVIEIKRGVLQRDALAQALDYASCIATMPFDELATKANAYLATRTSSSTPISLRQLLDDRQGKETPSDDYREVEICIAGMGKAPGLERTVQFLARRYQVPISVVLFTVYQLQDGEQVLVRDLTDAEVPAARAATVDEIVALADQHGTGNDFRVILECAKKHGLYPRPYKQSVMYTHPGNRTRMLFTVWIRSNSSAGVRVWIAPEVFAEFYGVSQENAAEILGPGGPKDIPLGEARDFAATLDRFYASLSEGTGEEK